MAPAPNLRPARRPQDIRTLAAGEGGAARRGFGLRATLFDQAYERLEHLIVHCELAPGRLVTVAELQSLTGLGRTPVHQAVARLAADTLVVVRPRHGLRIAPIDLARERVLLDLRRDVERFVVRLAAERASAAERTQMRHLARHLEARRDGLAIGAFNQIDRRIDALVLAAAGEPFLENTLRPLHTIFRRIGWLYHAGLDRSPGLAGTIDAHLAVLDAVANGHAPRATEAVDALIAFITRMFDAVERGIDPVLLDCSIRPLLPA
jgi:DNA-binding GntR family transcriptional regulator